MPTPDLATPRVPEPPVRRSRFGLGVVLSVVAIPGAIVTAWLIVAVYAIGMSDCVDFDAGGRCGAFVEFILISGGLWIGYTVAGAIGALTDSVPVALAAGIVLTLVVAYLYLSGVPQASSEMSERFRGCLNGVPNWWPWFFPH
jgi:hypothetical protein